MPLVPDTCVKCKRPVKSSVICNTCQQHFHPGCARDYVKNRPLTDCCRKKFNYLLGNLDAKTRLASIKSTSSNTSSVSSFKSASSSPLDHTFKARGSTSLVRLSTARVSTSLKSPVTPNTPISPGPDSVFHSSIPSPEMLQLPSDWFEKSLDDKMTTMMEQFLSSNMSVNKKLEDLSTQITDLKNSQAATVADLSEVKISVKTNAESISELNSEIKKLKEDYKSNMNTMHNNLADLNKIVNLENRETSSTSSLSGSTTELVIAGIPNSVADNLSPSEIQSAVLNALELPHLVSDVLSVREFQNKSRPRQDKVNHSYLVDLKSSRVRDFIISSKRKSKNLLAKIVFPDYVDQNFKGAIYVNEFLLPEIYKLLLQTKEKAKLKKFKYVWVTSGQIFVKRDNGSEILKINCVSDLAKLD
ncbi:serine-rich adhesin for platelets-like [Cotesia glomerata]|uniref:serine-rich adhesin for platelets-like n=1 Tax=Cotesia glomerata TaxID=32391 RepID=UPI001D00B396|nr:serine-rich adhesin for platelets-like [Cotesia glomerata]